MRIGTWNLAGRWDERHLQCIRAMDCDILLLTEVSERVDIPGYAVHAGQQFMSSGRRWAAIASRMPMTAQPDPHGASVLAEIDGFRVCSSVLPWRSCGSRAPWVGETSAQKSAAVVAAVESVAPAVWGGDWNHALAGKEWTGSVAGRHSLLAAVDRLGLKVVTTSAPHQIDGLLSIDHIAVPEAWAVSRAQRHRATVGESRISDHDAYVVEVGGCQTG